MSSTIKRRFAIFALLLVITGAYFFIQWYQHDRFFESTENAYLQAEITRVSSQLAARIETVVVTDNQRVQQGDVLATLDTEEFQIALDRAAAALAIREAELLQARSKLAQHGSFIGANQAQVSANQASLERLQVDLNRAQALRKPGYISEERITTLNADNKIARSQLAKADADLRAQHQALEGLQAEVMRLEAMIRSAKSDVAQAELNLSRTSIYAPISGVVGQRAARNGQLVQSGTYLLSIVPEQTVWVQANFKETQIERITPGLTARLVFDTFPNTPIKAKVESLFAASGAQFSVLPPDNATGNFTKVVQRIPVKLMLAEDHPLQGRLRPGMSVLVSIDTRAAQ